MAKEIVEMLVESVVLEVPDTKTVRLRWPEGYDVEFRTGQFITVCWPDDPQYKRAYSLSSCSLDRGFFDVTVKRDGKMGTRIVDWAKEGNRVGVLGPAGRFLPVFEPDRHLVCIAGGSGVTPFRGFVREATRRGLDTRITILYSVRTPRYAIFRDEFRQLEMENSRFKFYVTCTRPVPDEPWPGRCGRVDAEWIGEQVQDLSKTTFYACGPTAFVEATESMLRERIGVPKEQIRTEKWG